MPRYDVRNDGMGPYAVFYCEYCDREFRSQPDIKNTLSNDVTQRVKGDLLRKVPLFGGALASNATANDPRYITALTAPQLDAHWGQVKDRFRECPTCKRVVCISDFDEVSGYCNDDSPRTNEINEARGEQAGAAIKGFAAAFGLGDVMKQAGEAAKSAQRATAELARCPKDGTLAKPGTKFCPECGSPMQQPAVQKCPNCGAETKGAKFCPECGTKLI
jgi:ribosomal protein L37AE/L43A